MNIAVIIAGGVGSRMGMSIPKQFVHVYDKPVLIYTLEGFEKHPEIDEIVCVCIPTWIETLRVLLKQYKISKCRTIVEGGGSCQESISKGVYALETKCTEDDNVIIHDGIRPMVDAEVLSDVLSVCRCCGNGVTSLPYNEQIFIVDKDNPSTTRQYIPRETLRRVSTPQAYKYGLLLRSYKRAFEEGIGIHGSSYTNTMMVELGETLYFAAGSDKNIKLTTPEDLQLFKGYLRSQKGE